MAKGCTKRMRNEVVFIVWYVGTWVGVMLAVAGDTTHTSMNKCEVMRVYLNIERGVENSAHIWSAARNVWERNLTNRCV